MRKYYAIFGLALVPRSNLLIFCYFAHLYMGKKYNVTPMAGKFFYSRKSGPKWASSANFVIFSSYFIIFHVFWNIKNLVKRFFYFFIRNLDRDFFKEIENREILDFGIIEEILCDLWTLSGPSIKYSHFLLFCSSRHG